MIQAKTPTQELANLRLRCFTQQESMELDEEDFKTKLKTLDLDIPELDDHTLHSQIFSLFLKTESTRSTIANVHLWQDLELVCGDNDIQKTFISCIDRTATCVGSDCLAHTLTHPISSMKTLKERQSAVKELLRNTKLANKLDATLQEAAKAEKTFLFMYQDESGFNKKVIASYYFNSTWPILKHLKTCNSRTECMQVLTLLDKIPSLALFAWYPAAQWGVSNFRAKYNAVTSNKETSKGELGRQFPTAKSFIKKNVYDGPDFSWKKLAEDKIKKHEEVTGKDLSPEDKKMLIKAWSEDVPKALPGLATFVEELLGNSSNEEISEEGFFKEILSFAFKNHGSEVSKTALKGMLKAQVPTSIGGVCKVGVGAGSMYLGVKREKNSNNITNYLQTQLIATSQIVRSMKECSKLIKKNSALRNGLEHHKDLHVLFDKTTHNVSYKLKKLVSLLLTDTFTGQSSYFTLKGRVLAAYSLMQDVKEELAPALKALGEVDALLSTAKLYQEFEDGNAGYSFPTYLDKQHPEITLVDMWNPFIPVNKVVKNSIALGKSMPQNIILSGPNAGGKSTFLKGITLSVLMAQTLGIAPVKELSFTPFEKINTYMNITDDTAGGNSLFKSEVLRAQGLLETVKGLDTRHFSLSIMDEMFSGTSPKEGAAASYAVAKNLSERHNSILLLASHFPLLTDLETDTSNFTNYQVRVARHDNGSFSYPFKLEKGIADQNVAMDILQQQGFDSSILTDANAVLNR